MKISDWKTKVQALFRPAQPDRAPISNGPRALSANADRKPVDISILSTGERLIHAPSLGAAAESRDLSADPYRDEVDRGAAEGIERWDGRSVRDIDTKRFYDHPCGKIGLVRQVDTLALEATALQKAGAEKSDALER